MSSTWRMMFLVSHLVQWVFIIVMVRDYGFVDRALYAEIAGLKSADAFAVAAQIGRFDFATLLLTVLGMALTLAGVFGFVEVRSRSERAAIEAAEPIARRVARETAEAQVKPEAGRLIEDFFERANIDLDKLPRRSTAHNPAQTLADSLDPDGDNGA